VQQVTKGDFDVNDLVGFTSNSIIVSRGDMNHASEIYDKENTWKQITNVNTRPMIHWN
jgi:hypothetical protein